MNIKKSNIVPILAGIIVICIGVFYFINKSSNIASPAGKVLSTDSALPDNVQISSSTDGSNTTVIVSSKPGFSTTVQTNCANGKCIHTATSTPFTSSDIKKMHDDMKMQMEAMNKFWETQNELFKRQQKMFEDLWSTSSF